MVKLTGVLHRTALSCGDAGELRRFGGVLEIGRDLARADGSDGIADGPRARDDCGHAVTLAGRVTKTENSD